MTLDCVSPVQDAALYIGQKLHIDQNEKPKVYDVIYVLARKSFSEKMVSFVTVWNVKHAECFSSNSTLPPIKKIEWHT